MPVAGCYSVLPMFKPCAVIPVYNHQEAVTDVVNGVLAQQLTCILVDDGSAPACAAVLDGLAGAKGNRVTLLRHPLIAAVAAVLTGVRHANRFYSRASDRCRRPALVEDCEFSKSALTAPDRSRYGTCRDTSVARCLTMFGFDQHVIAGIEDSMRVSGYPGAVAEFDRQRNLA
jgi:hypothetical protein